MIEDILGKYPFAQYALDDVESNWPPLRSQWDMLEKQKTRPRQLRLCEIFERTIRAPANQKEALMVFGIFSLSPVEFGSHKIPEYDRRVRNIFDEVALAAKQDKEDPAWRAKATALLHGLAKDARITGFKNNEWEDRPPMALARFRIASNIILFEEIIKNSPAEAQKLVDGMQKPKAKENLKILLEQIQAPDLEHFFEARLALLKYTASQHALKLPPPSI